MTEGKTPTLRTATHQIEHQPDAERADETAGIAAHAVQPHRGAAQFLIGCTVPAVKAELSKQIAAFHITTSKAAATAGALAPQPVSSDKAAAVPHRDGDDARPAPSLGGLITGDRDGDAGQARDRE
jgi:hypothetical protein